MTKKKTGTNKFKAIKFSLDEFPGCCGIGVASYFTEDEGRYDYDWAARKNVHKPGVTYDTKEEVAEECYKEILKTMKEEGYTTISVSLVSKYHKPTKKELDDMWSEEERKDAKERGGTAQFPQLEEILKREKWKKLTFVNPNHGNTVTMYTKHFKEWVKPMLQENQDNVW